MALSDPLFRRNLAALAVFQVNVAQVIEESPIPNGVVEAIGRDGSQTLRVPDSNGRLLWFGGSSMPSISAAELYGGFVSTGENVALPGVLTGFEILLILSRLPRHAALFVIENEPALVKLAMHLHDYERALRAGQLVILLDGSLAKSIECFFGQHPGYTMPATLLTAPQRSAAQISVWQRALECAAGGVADLQRLEIERVQARLTARPRSDLPASPRVAVIGSDAGMLTRMQAERLHGALDSLRWEHEVCVPDQPGNGHLVALLRAIDRIGADLVLVVNAPTGLITPWLPTGIPAVSWSLPDVIASSVPHSDRPRTVEESTRRGSGDQRRATLLMDLPDVQAEALKLTLPSHLGLWQQVLEIAERFGDSLEETSAEQWFDRAQAASGTTIRDPSIRGHFTALIRGCVIPNVVGRATVRTLVRSGVAPTVFGTGWPDDPVAQRGGPIPWGNTLQDILTATECLVLPDPGVVYIQTALDALVEGAEVFCRFHPAWFRREYPRLADVLEFLHPYQTSMELMEAVRRWRYDVSLSGTMRRRDRREWILSRHSTAERVRSIVESLRSGVPICGPF